MAMTPQQRSDAARKASATRRANRANGTTPPARPRRATRGGPAFAAPAPSTRGQKLIALAALEDLFALKLRDTGITQDDRDAFARYEKLKALALGPTTNSAMQTEADSALRMATIALVKVAF